MKRRAPAQPDDENGKNDARIVRRNGREISTREGIYTHKITVEMALRHRSRLVTVEEITKLQFGRVSPELCRFTRSQLWYDVNLLIDLDELAILKYEDRGYHRILGIKIYNSKTDAGMFAVWFERYRRRRNQTIAKIRKVDQLRAEADGSN